MKFNYLITCVFFSLFIISCAIPGHHYIKIKAPPFGAEYIPEQISDLLEKSGFNQIGFSTKVVDPGASGVDPLDTKKGVTIQSSDKLLMRFQHKTVTSLMVKVAIGRDKGNSKLEFYEINKTQLSAEAMAIYKKFKINLKAVIYDKNAFREN